MEEVVETAESLLKNVGNFMKLILSDDSSQFDNEQAYKAISTIEQCKERVDKEHLFSVNEQIEDINTLSIKFLFLPYYAGKCYQSIRDMESRLINILAAKDKFTSYLQECTRLGVLHEEGCNLVEKMTADAKRQHKIEQFKRDRAAKKRINELQRLLYITRNDTDSDHEEELRELFLTQLQCYAHESRDEIDMIQQEILMLRYQEQQLQQKLAAEGARSTDARMIDDRSRGTSGKGVYVDNYNTLTPQQGPGISVTRTFKVGDQIMFSRETVKATVFGSRIAPPSMSLEEFGDQQKTEAIERQAREEETTENDAARSGRRYKQLLEDGDEDDADLMDQAAEKDRAWDDWKDNNPRGWGNKMGKRF